MDWDRRIVSYFSARVIDHGKACLSRNLEIGPPSPEQITCPFGGKTWKKNVKMANQNIGACQLRMNDIWKFKIFKWVVFRFILTHLCFNKLLLSKEANLFSDNSFKNS